MTRLGGFLSRTQGRDGLSWMDWLAYGYLALGFLVILIPVLWLGLNSFKSQGALERHDTNLLPLNYVRLGRASVTTPEGRSFVLIEGLPDWVLDWGSLSQEERADQDVSGFLANFSGDEALALQSHLGVTEQLARRLIADQGFDSCLLSYAATTADLRQNCDIATPLVRLGDPTQRAVLGSFLGLSAYRVGQLSGQIRVSAPDPETGEVRIWAVPRLTSPNGNLLARPLDDPNARPTQLPAATIVAQSRIVAQVQNYIDPIRGTVAGLDVNFARCFSNSVLVTVLATVLTLIINAMAAFALSKYRFRGHLLSLIIILGTLMVPPAVMLIGVFKMIQATGLGGSLWGVIIPGAATPTGVFLLRQYMLTIPDELLEAARMDAASEWKIFWRLVVPLAMPAIAALGILSVIWRWNDLILPLVAIPTQIEAHTLQLCLLNFNGENVQQPHYRLAMTMLSLIPTTLVFVFLQRFITTGVAASGVK